MKNTGVIAAISDFSIPIDRVVGTSSGALAAALFANGYDSFEIATGDLWSMMNFVESYVRLLDYSEVWLWMIATKVTNPMALQKM